MTISLIRKSTDKDKKRVLAAALRLIYRHNLTIIHNDDADAEMSVQAAIYSGDIPKAVWQRCFCRALQQQYNSRLTLAHGHIGITV